MTAVNGLSTFNAIAMHLMLAITPFWLTLPLQKMNQLGESATILCRSDTDISFYVSFSTLYLFLLFMSFFMFCTVIYDHFALIKTSYKTVYEG